MIQEGVVSLQMRLGQANDEKSVQEFFVLPTFSYFGDYQILFELKSQIIYKAKENKLLTTLCIVKDKLLELMDDYPEARKYYMERAWLRRIEFRRRQKKFIKELISLDLSQYNKDKVIEETEEQSDDSYVSGDESLQSDTEEQKQMMKKKAQIADAIDKNISRFYFNLDIEKELDEDFNCDELEDFSDDEIEPDEEDMLKEDNKKESYSHAKAINEQMIKMSVAFAQMTQSTEKNLNEVQ